MAFIPEDGPFWAGGSPERWFVQYRPERHQSWQSPDAVIRNYESRDCGGEGLACLAANRLASALNSAWKDHA